MPVLHNKQEVRMFVVNTIREQGWVDTYDLMEEFGMSRQCAIRHLTQVETETNLIIRCQRNREKKTSILIWVFNPKKLNL